MSSAVIQLLVLAGIAVFLILRLRNVLGTRSGYEKPPVEGARRSESARDKRPEFEVIEGGPDRDIVDHVDDGSDDAKALASMKMAEPGFNVTEFLSGARQAYEMILTDFEKGDISDVRFILAPDVAEAFDSVIAEREAQGLVIEFEMVGVRETSLIEARFDQEESRAEITVRFLGEMTTAVRDSAGEIIEGDSGQIKRQRDAWTFSRVMGADDPNWQLVATGE